MENYKIFSPPRIYKPHNVGYFQTHPISEKPFHTVSDFFNFPTINYLFYILRHRLMPNLS